MSSGCKRCIFIGFGRKHDIDRDTSWFLRAELSFGPRMASLEISLDRRNVWQQSITLELFNGVKDIFRDRLPVETSLKQHFVLTPGAVTPVALYEFELRELFVEATVKSGCKWWCRISNRSKARARVSRSLWSTRFVCRHFEKSYVKQVKDNSRNSRPILRCSCPASCVLKAISVRDYARLFSFAYTALG